jgi:hypothetical protein
MKKILLITIMFLLFAGVVSASSINGDYKGSPIVKVIFNGNTIASDVPAVIIDGVTMIPLRAIADNMDSVVSWNQDTYTVGIYQRSFITSEANKYRDSQPGQTPATKKIVALSLYSNDGKVFLGKITADEYDSDSIYNEYGTYGSKYSTESIWNEYGDYGSKYSSKSAFNELATEPPIILDGKRTIVGYLTTNTTLKEAVSPIGLKEFLADNGY